jgi:hypothetical protein
MKSEKKNSTTKHLFATKSAPFHRRICQSVLLQGLNDQWQKCLRLQGDSMGEACAIDTGATGKTLKIL